MTFNDLLDIASVGNDTIKFSILKGWVQAYSEVLELMIELRRLEKDLQNPDMIISNGHLMICQGKLQLSVDSLSRLEKDLIQYDTKQKQYREELLNECKKAKKTKKDELCEVNTDDIPHTA